MSNLEVMAKSDIDVSPSPLYVALEQAGNSFKNLEDTITELTSKLDPVRVNYPELDSIDSPLKEKVQHSDVTTKIEQLSYGMDTVRSFIIRVINQLDV